MWLTRIRDTVTSTARGSGRHVSRRSLRVRLDAWAESSARVASPRGGHPRAARPDRRPENAPGDFFVDHTCIDCDACRWIAPDTFTRVGGMSAVTTQPRDANTRATALRALLSCPTSSIHLDAPADEVKRAHEDFPRRLRVSADDDDLDGDATTSTSCFRAYHLGFHSRSSYGAAPYLIALPDGRGCVMVDCPAGPLPSRLDSDVPARSGPSSPSSSRTKTTSPTTTDGRRRWTSRGCYTRTI